MNVLQSNWTTATRSYQPPLLLDLVECTCRSDDPLYLRGHGNFVSITLYPLSGAKVIKTPVKLLNRVMDCGLSFLFGGGVRKVLLASNGIFDFWAKKDGKSPISVQHGGIDARPQHVHVQGTPIKWVEIKVAVFGTWKNIRPPCPMTQSDNPLQFQLEKITECENLLCIKYQSQFNSRTIDSRNDVMFFSIVRPASVYLKVSDGFLFPCETEDVHHMCFFISVKFVTENGSNGRK